MAFVRWLVSDFIREMRENLEVLVMMIRGNRW